MITLTEPQSWVIIGVFATAIFGMLSWQTVFLGRSITSLADRFDAKIDGLREATDAKLEILRTDLGGKIDGLDRDVQAIARHVFGSDPH
ncbi:MAG: hypothetical protein ACOH19_01920 [Rhodoglobus sp.]